MFALYIGQNICITFAYKKPKKFCLKSASEISSQNKQSNKYLQ